MLPEQGFRLGAMEAVYRESLSELANRDIVARFWRKDLSLWPAFDSRRGRPSESLDWMDLPQGIEAAIGRVSALAARLGGNGIRDVVFLATSASSSAAEIVLTCALPTRGVRFHLLHRIDALAIRALEKQLDFRFTLFLVSSKTGKNLELHALLLYLLDRVKASGNKVPGSQFVAITEEGSYLASLASESLFQATLVEPNGFRGRFSGIQHYGLLLGGLCDLDAGNILSRIKQTESECRLRGRLEVNPAVRIAAFLVAMLREGRHRLIFRAPEKLVPLAKRFAHLIGCSTCKEETGILPFVEMTAVTDDTLRNYCCACDVEMPGEPALRELEAAIPAITVNVDAIESLPAKVFEWEIGTAMACSLMEVNPFQDSDYLDGRDDAMRHLEEFSVRKHFDFPRPRIAQENLALFVDTEFRSEVSSLSLEHALASVLNLCAADGYCVFLNYLWHLPVVKGVLTDCAAEISSRLSVPVQVVPGPRYLHLLGQCYKGGPRGGIAILLTCEATETIDVPGAGYTFGDLRIALALGDFDAMNRRGRPIVRLHLSGNPEAAAEELGAVLRKAVKLYSRSR